VKYIDAIVIASSLRSGNKRRGCEGKSLYNRYANNVRHYKQLGTNYKIQTSKFTRQIFNNLNIFHTYYTCMIMQIILPASF